MKEIEKTGQSYTGLNNPVQSPSTSGKDISWTFTRFWYHWCCLHPKSYILVSWTQMQMITWVLVHLDQEDLNVKKIRIIAEEGPLTP